MKRFRMGVMQGRLLPKYLDRYQAHPVGYWQNEFALAAELELDLIEFILDYDQVEQNPLLTQNGIREIIHLMDQTGVRVRSVCGDYFMQSAFHNNTIEQIDRGRKVLGLLLENAGELGLETIVIPCVDQSSLQNNPVFFQQFCDNIRPLLIQAEDVGVVLALETDLSPEPFATLLTMLDSPSAGVNYDLGNSASLGYNVSEEWAAYGEKVVDIHLKDRVLGGGSVVFGTGNADFEGLFAAIDRNKYNGVIIMQAFRDAEGLAVFRQQLDWVLPKMGGWGRQ